MNTLVLSVVNASYNVSRFICYVEHCSILIYSRLGISKFKSTNSVLLFASYSTINYLTLSYTSLSSYLKLLSSTLSNCLFSTCFGFLSKYRMKGLGHRIYIKRNTFVFKIGYSHMVYKLLDLNLLNRPKRHKKEYYFCLRGLDNINLQRSLFILQSYRLPNCYCFNGIFIRGVQVDAKEGKKGFML